MDASASVDSSGDAGNRPSISALISRFRYGAPSAPSERMAKRGEIAKQFWWLDEAALSSVHHSVDSEVQTEDSLQLPRDSYDISVDQRSLPPPPPPPIMPSKSQDLPEEFRVRSIFDLQKLPGNVADLIEAERRRIQLDRSRGSSSTLPSASYVDMRGSDSDDDAVDMGDSITDMKERVYDRAERLLRHCETPAKPLEISAEPPLTVTVDAPPPRVVYTAETDASLSIHSSLSSSFPLHSSQPPSATSAQASAALMYLSSSSETGGLLSMYHQQQQALQRRREAAGTKRPVDWDAKSRHLETLVSPHLAHDALVRQLWERWQELHSLRRAAVEQQQRRQQPRR
eukprot:gene4812-3448_t